jgi:hypothetical protein
MPLSSTSEVPTSDTCCNQTKARKGRLDLIHPYVAHVVLTDLSAVLLEFGSDVVAATLVR